MVKPIPDGYPRVTPYLIVDGASAAIDFYTSVLGATERMRMGAPGDTVGHAELEIGESVIMLADEAPEMDARSAKHYGGSPVTLMVYVDDVDKLFPQAVDAGAKEVRPGAEQLYGERSGTVKDPFGHRWQRSTN
jgi:PhnB protein